MGHPARLVVAVLTVATVATACSDQGMGERAERTTTTSAGPTTTWPELGPPDPASGFPDSWRPETLDWEACDDIDVAECATLTVPLDWDRPDGPTIDLALARERATGARIGSLVTNPGGPGASGLAFLEFQPFDAALTERFDVVSWDPRGVGRSSPLSCGDEVAPFLQIDTDPDDPAEQAELERAAAALAAECGAEDAELLAHLGTDDVARDLEAIRMALDEPRLDYVGFSYGTLIGERYLDLFGERVRAMVLDAVVDPTEGLVGLLEGQTVALDAALGRIFDSCRPATGCGLDDAAQAYDELARRVETEPLPAATDVGPAELATAALYATYDPELWPLLLDAVEAGLDGDGEPLWELASGYYDLGDWTAYAGVTCLDSPRPAGADEYRAFVSRLEAASARLGAHVGNEMLPCAFWPTPPIDVTGPVTGTSGPDVLVLGNTGDPATPYDDAVDVAAMLERGHLVTYEGEGHTSYGRDRCVDAVVHAYLIDLTVPEGDPRCGGTSSVV